IRNTVAADAGDWTLSDCVISQGARQATAAIRIESSGGGKISNLKINGAGGGGSALSFLNGIDATLTTPYSTSILLVSNSSIENLRGDGIIASGINLVKVNGVEFGLYGNSAGVPVHLISVGQATVGDVVAQNSIPANVVVQLDSCSRVSVGRIAARDYTFRVGFSGTYTASGSTLFSPLTLQNQPVLADGGHRRQRRGVGGDLERLARVLFHVQEVRLMRKAFNAALSGWREISTAVN
ncbi:MAG: hypothetical protein LC746_08290, partial [Acidobacteria bacterium]|nr:hypothetical protein [Acidobacteriota bacterium]